MMKKKEVPLQDAELTMHCLIGQKDQGLNILADNLCLRIIENKEEITFVFYKNFEKTLKDFEKKAKIDLKKPITFVADYTNDPTEDRAGGQVSMGYYLFRAHLEHGLIHSFAPLIITGAKKDHETKLIRPQRLLYEPIQKGLPVNLDDYPVDKETVYIIKDYIMPKNTWNKAYLAILTYCEKNKTSFSIITEMDFRSFHCLPTIFDFQEYKEKEFDEIIELHEAFLTKQISLLNREENYFNLR